jgi:hypothetical protein
MPPSHVKRETRRTRPRNTPAKNKRREDDYQKYQQKEKCAVNVYDIVAQKHTYAQIESMIPFLIQSRKVAQSCSLCATPAFRTTSESGMYFPLLGRGEKGAGIEYNARLRHMSACILTLRGRARDVKGGR